MLHTEKGTSLSCMKTSTGDEVNVIAQQCCSRFNDAQQHITTTLVYCIELHTHGGAYITSLLGQ